VFHGQDELSFADVSRHAGHSLYIQHLELTLRKGNPVPRIIAVGPVCFTLMMLASATAFAQAQVQVQKQPPPALELPAADIKSFIDKLPKDRITDAPIRVTDAGGYKVGVYGVFRPKAVVQASNRHETTITEIYYMLEGTATIVTGGTMVDEKSSGTSPNSKRPNFQGTGIQGGVSRHVGPGDVIVIPGNLPHWWSSLDTDIRYLIFRPDPEGLQAIK